GKGASGSAHVHLLLAPGYEDVEDDHKKHTRDHANHCHIIHLATPFRVGVPSYWKNRLKFRLMLMTAGANNTINILGKMNKARGKIILMVVLAANSSASCRRFRRRPSAKALREREMGVPKRSVCTSMLTKERTTSRSVRAAMLRQAS